jgi:hypothetical protein
MTNEAPGQTHKAYDRERMYRHPSKCLQRVAIQTRPRCKFSKKNSAHAANLQRLQRYCSDFFEILNYSPLCRSKEKTDCSENSEKMAKKFFQNTRARVCLKKSLGPIFRCYRCKSSKPYIPMPSIHSRTFKIAVLSLQ